MESGDEEQPGGDGRVRWAAGRRAADGGESGAAGTDAGEGADAGVGAGDEEAHISEARCSPQPASWPGTPRCSPQPASWPGTPRCGAPKFGTVSSGVCAGGVPAANEPEARCAVGGDCDPGPCGGDPAGAVGGGGEDRIHGASKDVDDGGHYEPSGDAKGEGRDGRRRRTARADSCEQGTAAEVCEDPDHGAQGAPAGGPEDSHAGSDARGADQPEDGEQQHAQPRSEEHMSELQSRQY